MVRKRGFEPPRGCPRQTIETGPDGNTYVYSPARAEDGGVITSLMDVHNNNIWLVETIARAATDNHWRRVDVKAGASAGPSVNGRFQGTVKSPMNKGRGYKRPAPNQLIDAQLARLS